MIVKLISHLMLYILLTVATMGDFKNYRISNRLILTGLGCAFLFLDRYSDIYLVQKKGGISQWREYEFTEELMERGLSNVVERIKLIEPQVITMPVKDASKLIGLNFCDHIIIGQDGYFSFSKANLQ